MSDKVVQRGNVINFGPADKAEVEVTLSRGKDGTWTFHYPEELLGEVPKIHMLFDIVPAVHREQQRLAGGIIAMLKDIKSTSLKRRRRLSAKVLPFPSVG